MSATPRKGMVLLAASLTAVLLLMVSRSDGNSQGVLDPRGPRAERIETLWWLLFAVGATVFIIVVGLLIVALFRAHRRRFDPEPLPDDTVATPYIVAGGVITALIMAGVFGFTLWTMDALSRPGETPNVSVAVTGNRWWWEVVYLDQGVVTANEIHIPVGEPVQVALTSDDVIHSFWVPQLAGKVDLLPGTTNKFWIEADEPGVYRGQCAEFCGIQHAMMEFLVVAEPREEFDSWIEGQQQPAPEPGFPQIEEGHDLFLSRGCALCHSVRGTEADGEVGPDLTHIASRRTLAAGALEFNQGNLYGWIADPQAIKPGALMPNLRLTRDELYAIVAYLLSLE